MIGLKSVALEKHSERFEKSLEGSRGSGKGEQGKGKYGQADRTKDVQKAKLLKEKKGKKDAVLAREQITFVAPL